MAYDGWLEFAEREFVNIARTAVLAPALGINTVWTRPEDVAWIESVLVEDDYEDVTTAPWYDPGYPASSEFAGFMPLAFTGLDDNTMASTPVEYITDGGFPGKKRHATLPIVASLVIVASTDRGAEYGRRYLDRLLAGLPNNLCQGNNLHYFRWADVDAPKAHRRNVRTTRGTSVTRKVYGDCSAMWWVTFTLTAGDPYEYGEVISSVLEVGEGGDAAGSTTHGTLAAMTNEGCPVYDYSPIYDPLYPALVPPPSIPNFYPAGWNILEGAAFDRYWARASAPEPSHTEVVPFIIARTSSEARGVVVTVWPAAAANDDQCGPLFSAAISYLPPGVDMVIDGEQQVAYVDDGGPVVRRADSLVYDPSAKPVEWSAFNDPTQFLLTVDVYDGGGDVTADFAFIPKSD